MPMVCKINGFRINQICGLSPILNGVAKVQAVAWAVEAVGLASKMAPHIRVEVETVPALPIEGCRFAISI